MNTITWLSQDFILTIHEELIEKFGGTRGLLSQTALESTLNKPQQIHFYAQNITLYHLAAAYAYGFIKNHCFIDGNKRVAFVSTYTFLRLHGWKLTVSQSEATNFFLTLADTQDPQNIVLERIAQWLECNSKSTEGEG